MPRGSRLRFLLVLHAKGCLAHVREGSVCNLKLVDPIAQAFGPISSLGLLSQPSLDHDLGDPLLISDVGH